MPKKNLNLVIWVLSRKAEDYLEAIYSIIQKKGYARTKDIARTLGVKSPSVTEMLRRLNEKGLVIYEKYGGVTLTPKGEEIAKVVKDRHETFAKLLKIIRIPEEIAKKDTLLMEHHLHPKTIEQFKKFVSFVENFPAPNPKWLKHFAEYCETGEFPECMYKED